MCGIAGILSLAGRPVTAPEIHAMCDTLVHRGPDDEGVHVGPGIGLGMRRLSIIDLQTGRQPVRNEDGTVSVVLNGEIYNFPELRRELTARGHRFTTATDTEVIVHLYEDLGPACVDRLRGMFAFAVWDDRRQRLLLARDRLGIKPLYYAEIGGRLLFASELKAILALPEVPRVLDPEALAHLLVFLTTPEARGFVAGVRKLPPGHRLEAEPGGKLRVERYWELAFQPDRRLTEAELVERLRELIEDSVRCHRLSDVPLGAFLSGGLDSSAVVATLARMSSAPVKTFSIGFADPAYDETAHARRVADRFRTEHHELRVEPDALDLVEDLAWHLDEPFGDSSAIPTYMVSRLAARHVTVVLSGDGGDELFAGYDKYRVEGRERRMRVPAPARHLLGRLGAVMPMGMRGRNAARHFALTGHARIVDAAAFFRRDDLAALLGPAVLDGHDPWAERVEALSRAAGNSDGGDWLSTLQSADLSGYLPLDILTKVDRMSMAHSIEARVPLLDHPLVEFAATIPPELQLRGETGKYLFKRAMEGILPAETVHRAKRGFAVPLARWFRGRLAGAVRDLLLSRRARERGLLAPAAVERLLTLHARGRDLDLQLWTLMSLELWCRLFLDGDGRAAPRPAIAERRA